MEIAYQLPRFLPTQRAFVERVRQGHPEDPDRILIAGYFGGWGSGKTTIGKWTVFDYLCQFPGLKALVVRDTFASLNLTSKKEFLERMVEGDPAGRNMAEVLRKSWNEQRQEYVHLSGSSVLFGGLDRTEKWGSTEFGLIWIDEASLCAPGDIEFLISRLRQKPPTCERCSGTGCGACERTGHRWGKAYRRALILTSNHVFTEHFLYKLFVDPGDGRKPSASYQFVECSSYENAPENGGHLPRGYLESLAESGDANMLSVYLNGRWGVIPKGTPIYRFQPVLNGKPWQQRPTTYDPNRPLYPALDFGYRFPFATLHQIQARNRWRVLAEFTMPASRTKEFLEGLAAYTEEHFPDAQVPVVYGDPAGWAERSEGPSDAQTVGQVLKVPFKSIASTARSKAGRRQLIRERMVQTAGDEPVFAIDHRRCPRLAEALAGMYRFPELKTSFTRTNYVEEPVEEHPYCDVMHSVEYFAANHFRLQNPGAGLAKPTPGRVGGYGFNRKS